MNAVQLVEALEAAAQGLDIPSALDDPEWETGEAQAKCEVRNVARDRLAEVHDDTYMGLLRAVVGLFDAPHATRRLSGLHGLYEGHGYMRCRLCQIVVVYDDGGIFEFHAHRDGCPVPVAADALAAVQRELEAE